jgi:hypothetical protein
LGKASAEFVFFGVFSLSGAPVGDLNVLQRPIYSEEAQ